MSNHARTCENAAASGDVNNAAAIIVLKLQNELWKPQLINSRYSPGN